MNEATVIRLVAEFKHLVASVADIEKRTRRLERLSWMLAGGVALLEFTRACQ